ncbi:hypothetical protein P9272_32035 [Mesorhizobium sp. WSM4976]|uniref:hypothetical protein n=1 Tax=Mesorhizobium sp. WSM4976 TaxID=3038549 RepID=UPI00241698E4|nr:hypothetical protein [Mesorhizobium sp. WSM4976]MDG4898171.1 hypothetical protein [Mesorhizobium sp. WSM4976]
MENNTDRPLTLRLSASLLLVGQILYVIVTLFHTGGDANNHPVIFEGYAASGTWNIVHVAQFACTAILLAGLLALFFGLDVQGETAKWTGRFGAALTVVSFTLYGVVLAVDGVALKQAVVAWEKAPEAEKAARFATAEAVRWLEWGTRSYEAFALGLAFVLFAVPVALAAKIPRPIAYLMALSGLAYWVQGWTAGSEGFSPAHVIGIEAAEVLNVIWAAWLLAFASRKGELSAAS